AARPPTATTLPLPAALPILAGPLLHHGRDGPAGHAPVSPKVDQNGKVGLEYLLFKIGVGHVQHSAVLTHPFPSLRFQPSQAETVDRKSTRSELQSRENLVCR